MASSPSRARRVIVVGAGIAGLMTAWKLCEDRVPVALFSSMPARRAHSGCEPGGFNAALATAGEDDRPALHLQDTLAAGGPLAAGPLLRGMTEAAPGLARLLDRMGVPFLRTREGLPALHRSGGSTRRRTLLAGASTGQQILFALDDQLRAHEARPCLDARGVEIPGEPLLQRHDPWDLLSLIRSPRGPVVGIVAQHLWTMEIRAFRADAVCLATGGHGALFPRSSASLTCTGTATAVAFLDGAVLADIDLFQLHPTATPGPGKPRLLGDRLLAGGGRLWVPKDPLDRRLPASIPERERRYVLEERHPAEGGLLSPGLASRELLRVSRERGHGESAGEREVYLDLPGVPPEVLRERWGEELRVYERSTGEDAGRGPMRVFPAVQGSLGGLWVDFEPDGRGGVVARSPRNHATSREGLYAVGQAQHRYHGEGLLGGNEHLACMYGGQLTGAAMAAYREAMGSGGEDEAGSVYEEAEGRERARQEALLRGEGGKKGEGVFRLRQALEEALEGVLEGPPEGLRQAVERVREVEERARQARVGDQGGRCNQSVQGRRHLEGMVALARVIAEGALRRREQGEGVTRRALVQRREGAVAWVQGFSYRCAGRTIEVTDETEEGAAV
jgi:succinate dehydrogenase / fumarate reductase flavoprotein subunit